MAEKAMLLNCRKCLEEIPRGVSPAKYGRLSVGLSTDGEIEVWCERHDRPVGVLTRDGILLDAIRTAPCSACGKVGKHEH